jgi:hypothetical protein
MQKLREFCAGVFAGLCVCVCVLYERESDAHVSGRSCACACACACACVGVCMFTRWQICVYIRTHTNTSTHVCMHTFIQKLTLKGGTSVIHPRTHALCTHIHTEDKDADTQEVILQAASSVILRVSKNSPPPMMLNPERREGKGRAGEVPEAFLIAFGREILKGPLRYAQVSKENYMGITPNSNQKSHIRQITYSCRI